MRWGPSPKRPPQPPAPLVWLLLLTAHVHVVHVQSLTEPSVIRNEDGNIVLEPTGHGHVSVRRLLRVGNSTHAAEMAIGDDGSAMLSSTNGGAFLLNKVDVERLLARVDGLTNALAAQQVEIENLRINLGLFGGVHFNTKQMPLFSHAQSGAWQGAVASEISGKMMIYAAPMNHRSLLIIDPSTNSYDVSSVDTDDSSPSKFAGVAAVQDTQRIYCIPQSARYIMVVDPVSLLWSKIDLPGGISAGPHWMGAVYTNGKIYAMPTAAGGPSYSAVLVFDPLTNATDVSTLTVVPENAGWNQGAVGPNGHIYCPPSNGGGSHSVLIINPFQNTTDQVSMTGVSFGYTNAAYSVTSGLIYSFPLVDSVSTMLIINPTSNTAHELPISLSSSGHRCGSTVAASNGLVYCVPLNPSYVGTFNTRTNSTSTAINGLSSSNFKWQTGVLAGDRIYGIPWEADRVLIVYVDPNPATMT